MKTLKGRESQKGQVISKNDDQKPFQAIKEEHWKLLKKLKGDKPKLKSLRYQINKEDKKQLKYFENLVKLELSTDYTKL